MSKVLGIIAEYNPFHNGHIYHINKSKQIANAEFTVAVIGGNFTQRGEPSLIDKWSKAKSALLGGVDLVLELPVLYSISSAENFAEGAIKILDSLGIVDDISFGTETSDITILNAFAEVLYREPKDFKNILSHELSKGLSYPKARENALMLYLNDVRKYSNILSSPNNILGIEYLKALQKNKSSINPIAIKRAKSLHNDTSISGTITSSTAIRNAMANKNTFNLNRVMPEYSYSTLKDNVVQRHTIQGLSTFDKENLYRLRKMPVEKISNLQDVSEGLEHSIKKAADSCNTVAELMNIVSSKRYTGTRIQRILLYSLLDITKKDIEMSKRIVPYARILGFNEKGKYLISESVRVNRKINFVASVKKFTTECKNRDFQTMLSKDILATNIYTLGYKKDSWSNLDFTHKIVSL